MSWRERTEGERRFERDGSLGRYQNPYETYGDYDERRRHRDWEDGFRESERRQEEREAEERAEEQRERQRAYEREQQRQMD